MLTFVLDHRIYRQIVLDREIGKEGACRELEQGRRGKGGGEGNGRARRDDAIHLSAAAQW